MEISMRKNAKKESLLNQGVCQKCKLQGMRIQKNKKIT
jgi:hypothetical protein